ncbi:hypothetical protein RRG08_021801 [Elysia crispata]|uniref:Uncharacterized protein n=1 Tax=Elysia crispata TaxID=231223 RepID=A0AAE1DPP1_9GAST|nr:hypothetical protein RRG08_021801 [Elysia crispata]
MLTSDITFIIIIEPYVSRRIPSYSFFGKTGCNFWKAKHAHRTCSGSGSSSCCGICFTGWIRLYLSCLHRDKGMVFVGTLLSAAVLSGGTFVGTLVGLVL